MKKGLLARLLRKLLPLLIIAAGIGLTVMMIALRDQPANTPVAERVVPVETMTVNSRDVTFRIASQGTVTPRTETVLVAEVSGMVESVSPDFVAGGFFQRGDVLLTLESADYEVAVEQARANLLSAEAQLEQERAQSEQAGREWDLSGRSREDAPILALRTPFLREAEARVLHAEAELARAERQLERTTIRAPYDALVREKMADVGQYISTGGQLARIFATDFAEIRLPLSNADLAWLELPRPGQLAPSDALPVTLEAVVAGKRQQWQGQIVRTEAAVDSSTRMQYAIARLEDPYALQREGAPLLAGTFVHAQLLGVTVPDLIVLPHHALRQGNQVLVMDAEQRLRQRQVNVLRGDAEQVYINNGLSAGDQVLISPVQVPIEGMRVNPEPAGA